MPSYIQGNLALDQKRSVPAAKVKIKETTRVVYRNKSLPTQEKMLYLFTVLLCVIVAGVIIWRYASIYQMNASIMKMQGEIREIQSQNSALMQEVEKLQSPERMKGEAVRLGFNLDDEKKVSSVTTGKASSGTSSGKNNKVASKP